VRVPRYARTRRRRDETAPNEVLHRILVIDRRQSRDRASAAGDDHLASLLDTLEVLAQSVVELAHAHLVSIAM
jgi:hypothetical protein